MPYYRGVNIAGAEFGPLPGTPETDYHHTTSSSAWNQVVTRLGTNAIVRYPFLWERIQPTLNGALDSAEVTRLTNALNAAATAGVKVILDVHNYARYNGLALGESGGPTQANFNDLWTRLVNQFKSHSAVFAWGLMNEPHDLPSGFAANTTHYNFDANVQGWAAEVGVVAYETTNKKDGAGSLRVTKTMGSGFDTIRVNDSSGLADDISSHGDTLSVWVLVPSGAPGTGWQARIEVQNSSFSWQAASNTGLTPGTWKQLTYTPTAGLLANCRAIGIQFEATGVNQSQNVYVDTVQQGNVITPRQLWESASQSMVNAVRTAEGSNYKPIMVALNNWSGLQVANVSHPGGPWITDSSGGDIYYEGHHYWDRDNSGDYPDTYAAEVTDAINRGYTAGGNLDALHTRVLTELAVFTTWLGSAKGFIGEFGWPWDVNVSNWNALAEVWLAAIDNANLWATQWAAGEWWGTYNLGNYVETNLATIRANNTPLENHKSVVSGGGGGTENVWFGITATISRTDSVPSVGITPSIVGTTIVHGHGTGNSITVSTPAGTTTGDVIIAVLNQDYKGESSHASLPPEFTTTHTVNATANGGSSEPPPLRLGYLRLTGPPASSYVFGRSTNTDWDAVLITLRDVSGTGSPYRVSPTFFNGTGTSNTAKSINGNAGDLLLGIFGKNNQSGFGNWTSVPSGMSLTVRTPGNPDWCSFQAVHLALPSTAATGDKVSNHSRNTGYTAALLTFQGVPSTTNLQPRSLETATNISKPSITGGTEIPVPIVVIPQKDFLDSIVPQSLSKIIQSRKITVNKRFELLNHHDEVIDDITPRVVGCTIEHGNFRNIHRTIELNLIHRLQWGYHRVKPWVQLDTPNGVSDWYPLGVSLLTAPEEELGQKPVIYQVGGYDKTYILDQQVSTAITAELQEPIIWTIRQILYSKGFDKDAISEAAGQELINTARSWSIIEEITELSIVNSLLGQINYRGLYMTPDGLPISEYYLPPSEQSINWAYSPLQRNTNVLHQRTVSNDFTNVPNRFIFWKADIAEETIPTVGDGLYIYDNLNDGPSSQIQRGNLVIPHKEGLEVNTQADLEYAAQRKINELMQSQVRIKIQTPINPIHGHFDIVRYDDPEGGIFGLFQHLTWRMDLFGGVMEHEFRSVETIE